MELPQHVGQFSGLFFLAHLECLYQLIKAGCEFLDRLLSPQIHDQCALGEHGSGQLLEADGRSWQRAENRLELNKMLKWRMA